MRGWQVSGSVRQGLAAGLEPRGGPGPDGHVVLFARLLVRRPKQPGDGHETLRVQRLSGQLCRLEQQHRGPQAHLRRRFFLVRCLVSQEAAEGLLKAQDELEALGGVVLARMACLQEGTSLLSPALIDVTGLDVPDEEHFGPLLKVYRYRDWDEALRLANDTRYGLSAGIFTQDIDRALRFANEVESGNIHINWGPQWRADLMPYGGLKDSGMGKEGPRYAVEEMTELKMVVVHLGG